MIKLEYIWLDGSNPQQLRSKTKIIPQEYLNPLDSNLYPVWSFDGSSTNQAKSGKGENTDCLLKPVFITKDPLRGGPHKLVLCEVLNPDGTPHKTNNRRKLSETSKRLNLNESNKDDTPWFGWDNFNGKSL